MAGTITTLSHCAIKDGKAYEGTKEEILNSILTWELDSSNTLIVHHPGYKDITYHSYDSSFTTSEIHDDVIKFLYTRLSDYGYRFYRSIL